MCARACVCVCVCMRTHTQRHRFDFHKIFSRLAEVKTFLTLINWMGKWLCLCAVDISARIASPQFNFLPNEIFGWFSVGIYLVVSVSTAIGKFTATAKTIRHRKHLLTFRGCDESIAVALFMLRSMRNIKRRHRKISHRFRNTQKVFACDGLVALLFSVGRRWEKFECFFHYKNQSDALRNEQIDRRRLPLIFHNFSSFAQIGFLVCDESRFTCVLS